MYDTLQISLEIPLAGGVTATASAFLALEDVGTAATPTSTPTTSSATTAAAATAPPPPPPATTTTASDSAPSPAPPGKGLQAAEATTATWATDAANFPLSAVTVTATWTATSTVSATAYGDTAPSQVGKTVLVSLNYLTVSPVIDALLEGGIVVLVKIGGPWQTV